MGFNATEIMEDMPTSKIHLATNGEWSHVGINEETGHNANMGAMGFESAGHFSPSPSRSKFSGPSIADVAKTIHAVQRVSKGKIDDGGGSAGKGDSYVEEKVKGCCG